MQELDEGGQPGPAPPPCGVGSLEAIRAKRGRDGERGCLGALRGAAAGSLVMVELLVARLGQEIRKSILVFFVN